MSCMRSSRNDATHHRDSAYRCVRPSGRTSWRWARHPRSPARPACCGSGRASPRTPSFRALLASPSSATDKTFDRVSTEAFSVSFLSFRGWAFSRSRVRLPCLWAVVAIRSRHEYDCAVHGWGTTMLQRAEILLERPSGSDLFARVPANFADRLRAPWSDLWNNLWMLSPRF